MAFQVNPVPATAAVGSSSATEATMAAGAASASATPLSAASVAPSVAAAQATSGAAQAQPATAATAAAQPQAAQGTAQAQQAETFNAPAFSLRSGASTREVMAGLTRSMADARTNEASAQRVFELHQQLMEAEKAMIQAVIDGMVSR